MIQYRHVKRALDLAVAAAGLVLSAPVLAAAAAGIKSHDGGPVLFKQTRVGRDCQPFSIYKFRTMEVDHGTVGQTLNGSVGVTPIGRILRRTKVDELPQLANVLRGEMSLVGPRPCLPETLDQMPDWAHARFAVRPGLTGLAQINGNAAIPWQMRWRYDVRYVSQLGLLADLSILCATAKAIVVGEENAAGVAI